MKLVIDVFVTPERLIGRTLDGCVWVDEPNVVAVKRATPPRADITILGIGGEVATTGSTIMEPAVDVEAFHPALSAGIVQWVAKATWSRRRPELHGLVAIIDRVETRVGIEGYHRLIKEVRVEFEGYFHDDLWMRWRI